MTTAQRSPGMQYFILIVLCWAVALTYRPSATFFSQDDFWFLERVTRANDWPSFWRLLGAADYFYRPASRVLMLKLEQTFFDLQPFAYHAMSWLVHIANCGMLFGLWRAVWKNDSMGFVAALYYGLQPVHFVPVSWVSGVQDLSVAFWALLSLLLYVHSHKTGRTRFRTLSLIAFGLAMLSKENGLVVLALIALIHVVLKRARFSIRSFLVDLSGYAGVAAAFLVLRISKAGGVPSSGPYALHFDLGLIWANLRWYVLEGLYGGERASAGLLGSLVALGVLVAFTLMIIFSHRYRWPVAIGSIWFLSALMPVLLIEHVYGYYLCFSLMGLGLVVSVLVDALWSHVSQRVQTATWTWRAAGITVTGTVVMAWLMMSQNALQSVRMADPLGLQDKARISQTTLNRVLSRCPQLSDGSILYIRGASERDFWAVGKGSLFRLYYYPRKIEVLFDLDTPPTEGLMTSPGLCVYDFERE